MYKLFFSYDPTVLVVKNDKTKVPYHERVRINLKRGSHDCLRFPNTSPGATITDGLNKSTRTSFQSKNFSQGRQRCSIILEYKGDLNFTPVLTVQRRDFTKVYTQTHKDVHVPMCSCVFVFVGVGVTIGWGAQEEYYTGCGQDTSRLQTKEGELRPTLNTDNTA